jgi:hypothetical protein
MVAQGRTTGTSISSHSWSCPTPRLSESHGRFKFLATVSVTNCNCLKTATPTGAQHVARRLGNNENFESKPPHSANHLFRRHILHETQESTQSDASGLTHQALPARLCAHTTYESARHAKHKHTSHVMTPRTITHVSIYLRRLTIRGLPPLHSKSISLH